MNLLQLQNILPVIFQIQVLMSKKYVTDLTAGETPGVELPTDQDSRVSQSSKVLKSNEMPQTNQLVKYKHPTGNWTTVQVLGRAGKAGGKYNNWLRAMVS